MVVLVDNDIEQFKCTILEKHGVCCTDNVLSCS